MITSHKHRHRGRERDDQAQNNLDEELKDIKARIDRLEKAVKQGVGVTYSRLQAQLDALSLEMKGLRKVLREALQKVLPGFDLDNKIEECCNDLQKRREISDRPDYSVW